MFKHKAGMQWLHLSVTSPVYCLHLQISPLNGTCHPKDMVDHLYWHLTVLLWHCDHIWNYFLTSFACFHCIKGGGTWVGFSPPQIWFLCYLVSSAKFNSYWRLKLNLSVFNKVFFVAYHIGRPPSRGIYPTPANRYDTSLSDAGTLLDSFIHILNCLHSVCKGQNRSAFVFFGRK